MRGYRVIARNVTAQDRGIIPTPAAVHTFAQLTFFLLVEAVPSGCNGNATTFSLYVLNLP